MARGLAVLCALAAVVVGAKAVTDQDVMNFALNIECVEAAFFNYAAYGQSLSSQLLGGGASCRTTALSSLPISLKALYQPLLEPQCRRLPCWVVCRAGRNRRLQGQLVASDPGHGRRVLSRGNQPCKSPLTCMDTSGKQDLSQARGPEL